MNTLTLKSADIHCDGCAASIKRALTVIAGVNDVQVDVEAQTVRIEFDAPADQLQIESAMDDAGFAVAQS
jgi:copper chaperone CopZ